MLQKEFVWIPLLREFEDNNTVNSVIIEVVKIEFSDVQLSVIDSQFRYEIGSAAQYDSQKVLLGRMTLEMKSFVIQTMIGDDPFCSFMTRRAFPSGLSHP
jgi:hypothetical protein